MRLTSKQTRKYILDKKPIFYVKNQYGYWLTLTEDNQMLLNRVVNEYIYQELEIDGRTGMIVCGTQKDGWWE